MLSSIKGGVGDGDACTRQAHAATFPSVPVHRRVGVVPALPLELAEGVVLNRVVEKGDRFHLRMAEMAGEDLQICVQMRGGVRRALELFDLITDVAQLIVQRSRHDRLARAPASPKDQLAAGGHDRGENLITVLLDDRHEILEAIVNSPVDVTWNNPSHV